MNESDLEPLDLPTHKEYTHRAHRFPGKFHPPLIKKILSDHSDHTAIADPMCGSGTVGVEGLVAERDVLCVDLDPLSCLITRAKTNPINGDVLLELGESILDNINELPQEGDVGEEAARREININVEGTPFGVPQNLFHWFEPYVAVGYSRLLKEIDHILGSSTDSKSEDAILTVLAAMIRRISRADPQPVSGLEVTKVRRKQLREGIDFNVERTFNETLNRLADGYSQLLEAGLLGRVEVEEADAKRFSGVIEQNEFEPTMIITSPPYCNAIEYTRRHRLEYEWLGLFDGPDVEDPRENRIETSREFFGSRTPRQEELRELPDVPHKEVKELTAKIENKGKERKANLLRKYFLDAHVWLSEIESTLPQSGVLCLIVGPSTSYGLTVDTPKYLCDIAEKAGLESRYRKDYKLINNKMQYPIQEDTTEVESFIKFEVN